jgi:hypothetical protein
MHGSNERMVRRTSSGSSGRSRWRMQERSLVGPVLSGAVARAAIPSGRRNSLVILDFLVFDHDPVRESSARGFVRSYAFTSCDGNTGWL